MTLFASEKDDAGATLVPVEMARTKAGAIEQRTVGGLGRQVSCSTTTGGASDAAAVVRWGTVTEWRETGVGGREQRRRAEQNSGARRGRMLL
ncbi:hypothetical protein FGB62_114g14 [Gracilaria domingensis]|nr:hypothetical protein FGB62_114g14 [Gracilaria domingensis]